MGMVGQITTDISVLSNLDLGAELLEYIVCWNTLFRGPTFLLPRIIPLS